MMTPTLRKLMIMIAAVLLLQGCIKNDIPYPRIQANFTYMSAKDQMQPAQIDSANRVVTLYFPEEANIYEVVIDSFATTPGAYVASQSIDSVPLDLSSSMSAILRLYQDYLWKITAVQNIQRELVIEGQIGSSVIDVVGGRVLVTVSDKVSLSSLRVENFKLGANGCHYIPDLTGKLVDFTHPVVINIDTHGHIRKWTIYVTQAKSAVTTVRADGWTNVAWVYGEAEANKTNTIQYRIKGDTEWTEVPENWLTHNGGDFYARITGLMPNTTYEARAMSDGAPGEALEFTTGSVLQIPGSNFDNWWLDGKVWCPWAEGGTQYWDTGNKGATTLGPSNTTPTDDTVDGSGQAARLETKFVGIGIIGKLAAGNIFVGKYVRTDGTNGVLSFGQEFKERPTKLTGYYKYTTAPISSTTAGFENLKGQPDSCIVWVALIDSPEPFEIRTNPSNRQLFDPNGDYVVAYGNMVTGQDVSAYAPFEITLDYKSTSRVPNYILVTASASQYGDYFTGGNGAVLYLDNFELKYDY